MDRGRIQAQFEVYSVVQPHREALRGDIGKEAKKEVGLR